MNLLTKNNILLILFFFLLISSISSYTLINIKQDLNKNIQNSLNTVLLSVQNAHYTLINQKILTSQSFASSPWLIDRTEKLLLLHSENKSLIQSNELTELRQRIKLRTQIMINDGLINEVIFLENKYNRDVASMNSIGIKETLEYIDGKINKIQLEEKIYISTSQLAKRQRTFNKGQFSNVCKLPLDKMYSEIIKFYE